jgi:Trypsin-co-occurring domain 1
MNGAENATRTVMATLPSGVPIRVEIAGPDSGDGMTSVGLKDLELGTALDTVGEIGSVVVEKLKAAKPSRATVELRLGFAVEAGKLTALWVGGKGEAALTVTLEWSEHHHTAKAAGGDA